MTRGVFTECSDYTFGEQCDKGCNCHDKSEICDKVTGACKLCRDYTYGLFCEKCNCFNKSEICNKITGACASGCAGGFMGINCARTCQYDMYGRNCRGICHCVAFGSCDRATGSCSANGGCGIGWKSHNGRTDCQLECSPGRYGRNCDKACHCLVQSGCHRRTGNCFEGGSGCAKGWTNHRGMFMCQLPCTPGTFGLYCRQKCHCQEACSTTDGLCGALGCADGWMNLPANTQNCQTPCPHGKFGAGCSHSCNCRNDGKCRKTDGHCFQGCPAGVWGPGCKTPCKDGRFGISCKSKCHCKDHDACSVTDGACIDGLCTAGWESLNHTIANCQSQCPRGTFGPKCRLRCRCVNGATCRNTNGYCPTGCPPGREGYDCRTITPCRDYTYGIDCQKRCNCSDSKEVCNKVTGYCPESGPSRSSSKDGLSTASTIGIVAGVLVVIVGLFITFCCRKYCKRRTIIRRTVSRNNEHNHTAVIFAELWTTETSASRDPLPTYTTVFPSGPDEPTRIAMASRDNTNMTSSVSQCPPSYDSLFPNGTTDLDTSL